MNMKMKKQILICTVCAVLLAGCGNINAADANNTAGRDSDRPAAETEAVREETETTSDESETSGESEKENIPAAESVRAEISSKNLFGDDLTEELENARELFEFAESVYNDSEKCDTADDGQILTVRFSDGNDEYAYSCCNDGVFARVRRGDKDKQEPKFFKPDSETSQKLKDMLLAYSALGYILKDAEYTVGTEHTETSYIKDLAGSVPDPYCETRYYYIDDRRTGFFLILTDGSALFYDQTTDELTDAVIDGTPYHRDLDFYEYFTDGNGKAFYRPESYDVFYTADDFEGDISPVPFPKAVAETDEYLYSFNIESDGEALTAEVWQNSETTEYILIQNGGLKAMWNYREGEGMTLMKAFRTDPVESGEIDEIIAHAEQHMADDKEAEEEKLPRSNEDWLRYDTEKYGLFDLCGGVNIGREVEPTGVVEEWRDYISSADKPFTLEYRWAGAGRNEYQISTTDGKNYYYRNDMEIHDGDDDYGGEEWTIDGRFFQSVYKTKEYSDREVNEYPMSDYGNEPPQLVTDLLFENEKYNEDYAGKCERAYEVTIGNDRYICEEWSLYLGRLWKVYIKDGNIVAWEGDFYNEPTVNTVIRLEKTAEGDLIQIPQDAKLHVSYD